MKREPKLYVAVENPPRRQQLKTDFPAGTFRGGHQGLAIPSSTFLGGRQSQNIPAGTFH